ncbi:MAG TPA: hypothetical protein EYN51_10750 [Flavobacteriales bacterium]|nr:hypothetical protein [Flavobacteriales bacterium]
MPVETLVKTDRLGAVNSMLRMIGESSVADLESPTRSDVVAAIELLYEVSREIQSEGWWFNRETIKLTPDVVTGEVLINSEVLSVDRVLYSPGKEYVERDGKLYNVKDNTYIFTDSYVELIVTYQFEFEKLPEVVRKAITSRATRFLCEARVLDISLAKILSQDELINRAKLEDAELSNGDYNVFKGPDLYKLVSPWHR